MGKTKLDQITTIKHIFVVVNYNKTLMSLFSDNLRHLRNQKNISQQKLSEILLISRARYVPYENGTSEAPYEVLLRISKYFHVSVDLLLTVDLKKIPFDSLLKLGDNRILLPITVDAKGENMIEIIPHKAKAGYLTGYSDPEFIESLQHISLPFLGRGKYRTFAIEGDSMPPYKEGSFIVGEYVENLADIKEGTTYVFHTKNDGITYKRVRKKYGKGLIVKSDNIAYEPYTIKYAEIIDVWKFTCALATVESEPDNMDNLNFKQIVTELRKDIIEIKRKL